MIEDAREAPTTSPELDRLLLDAKVSIPSPHPGAVSRAALIEQAKASGCRVVDVIAPPGYGKSTLLAQWAAEEQRPVAWVSLDRLDDDPASLLKLLAFAFARIFPEHDGLAAEMRGSGLAVLGRAAPRLASALRTANTPFVLMIDDLQELASPDCHDVLSVVMTGVPDGSQLVGASRYELPHVHRMRASGDAHEITTDDLALDADAARQIFHEAHVEASAELAEEVTERTEGWAVGMHLAAVIARDSHGDALVAGDDRYVADYLYQESLAGLPDDVQRFLRRTAIAEQLTAGLCDALTGDVDGQSRLQELEASDVFLIPVDRRREWYRYHPLYREFLLAELRRVEPESIATLHLHAADWYEANGSPGLAVEHLLTAGAYERCVRLVGDLALPTYQAGQLTTVQRWLTALGDDVVAGFPPLALLAGWISAAAGRAVDTDRWGAAIDTATYADEPIGGMASFESARAMLRSMRVPDGPEQAMTDALLAESREPSWSVWRDQALCVLGEAELLAGDHERADELFAEAATIASVLGNTDVLVLSLSERAFIAIEKGHWDDAALLVEPALAAIAELGMQDYSTTLLVFAAAARIALHRGDLHGADRHVTQAMRSRPVSTYAMPAIAVRLRLHLAKVHWAKGEPATAHHLLREIDDVLLHRPHLGALLTEVDGFRELIASVEQSGHGDAPPLTPAELRLLPYLQTHLTIREIGDRLFLSRNTVNSQIGSIYRKLGVSTRGEAVVRATGIGLIGG